MILKNESLTQSSSLQPYFSTQNRCHNDLERPLHQVLPSSESKSKGYFCNDPDFQVSLDLCHCNEQQKIKENTLSQTELLHLRKKKKFSPLVVLSDKYQINFLEPVLRKRCRMMMVSLKESYNGLKWLLLVRIWAQMGPELDKVISLFSKSIRRLCQDGKRYK